MNRTRVIKDLGALGATALLTACGGDTVTRTASGLLTPDTSSRLTRPFLKKHYFTLGDYYFDGPGWFIQGAGYSIFDTSKKSSFVIGYSIASKWDDPSGNPGAQIDLLWGCDNKPPSGYNCKRDFGTVTFGTAPKDWDRWLHRHVIRIFDKWWHVLDGVPPGAHGGTLRDYSGNPIFTAYKLDKSAHFYEYQSGKQYEVPWKWPGGGGDDDISSACRNAIAGFAVGFAAGLAGAITSEVGVGWIGVIGGSIEMINSAINIRENCFNK